MMSPQTVGFWVVLQSPATLARAASGSRRERLMMPGEAAASERTQADALVTLSVAFQVARLALQSMSAT